MRASVLDICRYTLVYRFLAKNRLEYGKEWKLYLKMHTHLQEHCSAVLKVGITKQGDSLLDFYNQRYEEYLFSTKVLRDRLDYLDRVWVIDQRELPDTLAVKAAMGLEAFGRPLDEKAAPLNTMCLIVWREAVMTSDFMTALYNAAASMVLRNRDGEKIETRLIKGITGCFEQMGADGTTAAEKLAIYKTHFEAKFLQATGEYYAAESRALIDDGTDVIYLHFLSFLSSFFYIYKTRGYSYTADAPTPAVARTHRAISSVGRKLSHHGADPCNSYDGITLKVFLSTSSWPKSTRGSKRRMAV